MNGVSLGALLLSTGRHHLALTRLVAESDMAGQVRQVGCFPGATRDAIRISSSLLIIILRFFFAVQLALLLELGSEVSLRVLLEDGLGEVQSDDDGHHGRFLLYHGH